MLSSRCANPGLTHPCTIARTYAPTHRFTHAQVRDLVLSNGLQLIIEPGRSIVGPTTVLVTTVVGTKHTPAKVLRLRAYNAYNAYSVVILSCSRSSSRTARCAS